ncbi:MAG: hypothetical protein QME64_10395 [bacterium]|nr:hypothetical protein [bacterium]
MKKCLIIGVMLLVATSVFAGPPWYAAGNYPGGGWVHDATTLMTDIGGGFYQKVTTISAGGDYDWIVSDSGWTNKYPSGMKNSYITATTGQVVTFWFDTNTYSDGFLPATNIPYTDYASFGTHVYVAVGGWQSEAGNPGDWDPATTAISLMHDDGLNGDSVAGDSIYTYRAIISTSGSYNYHVALDGGWTRQVGTDGKNSDGSNFPFAVLVAGDIVKFEVETVKGRIKASSYVSDTIAPVWNSTIGAQTASSGDGCITVYWNGATDTSSLPVFYSIYYSMLTTINITHFAKLTHVTATTGTGYDYEYTISELASGTTYYIVVRAEDSSGNEAGAPSRR